MQEAYAQALLRMIEAGKKPAEAVAALKKNLEEKGRLALLPKIARAFERLATREMRKNTLTLTIARQKDAKHALDEAKAIIVGEGIQETDLCEVIDDTLIGGWRLEGRGLLVDQSWKEKLLSIYNRATLSA